MVLFHAEQRLDGVGADGNVTGWSLLELDGTVSIAVLHGVLNSNISCQRLSTFRQIGLVWLSYRESRAAGAPCLPPRERAGVRETGMRPAICIVGGAAGRMPVSFSVVIELFRLPPPAGCN